jgi:serine/threonine-protein kinase RsbW
MSQTSKEISCTIHSRLEELSKIEHLSEKVARKMDLSEDQQDNLSIAVTEAVGNAIVHGNKKDSRKKVYIIFQLEKDRVKVTVRDEGRGFDPDQLTDPLDPRNIMKESGRGLFILKTLMDDVSFTFSPKGTTIYFVMKKKDNIQ